MSERGGGEFIKHDVSKLSKKGDALPKTVNERVSLGSDNEGLYRRQISKIVGEIDDSKMLDISRSDNDRSTSAINILKTNFNVVSLQGLRDKQQDPNIGEYVREGLKKSEVRLAKAVLFSLKNNGASDSDFVSAQGIDDKLPEELKGLGEVISSFVITDHKIKEALRGVETYRNGLQIDDYDKKKDLVLKQIDEATKTIFKSMKSDNIKQVELANNYLNSLKTEVLRNNEKEWITDEIINYLNDHIIRSDVTVDGDLNLRNLSGGDDFEKDDTGNYKNPETVRWLREREQRATDLIMICSGCEFSSVGEISKKLSQGGPLSPYYTREDGTRGEKEYLVGLKDTLGFCVYETIQDSGILANQTILGTLNTNRIDKLLPETMGDSIDIDSETAMAITLPGLSDDVVVNAAKDPFLKEQLRRICLLDKRKEFSLLSIHGGFSDIKTKEALKKEITSIIQKVVGDKKMGTDRNFRIEAERMQEWLSGRVEVYQQLILKQEKLGRYGEYVPTEPKERKELIRSLLDTVEASGSPPGSLNIMEQCTKLFNMTQSEIVESELKTEISARLSLAFLYYHMHSAGGLLNNRGQSMEDAYEQTHKEGLDLDYEAMKFFLKDGANGIRTAEFWNEFEEINFGDNYHKTLCEMVGLVPKLKGITITKDGDHKPNFEYDGIKSTISENSEAGKFLLSLKGSEEVKGSKNVSSILGISVGDMGKLTNEEYLEKWTEDIRIEFVKDGSGFQNWRSKFWGENAPDGAMYGNYFIDGDTVRKDIVNKFLIRKVKEKTGEKDDALLEKGLELALKLLDATGESSVFNPCFAGHNDFSELILSEANTKDRQDKGKTIGSLSAIEQIVSFGTTWPRFISGGSGDKDAMSVFKPLLTQMINVERIRKPKNDGYTFYTAIVAKKFIPAQSFFMSETVPKETLTFEFWKKLTDSMTKVVDYGQDTLTGARLNEKVSRSGKEQKKEGIKKLNKLAVQSILGLVSRYDCDWGFGQVRKLRDIVTKKITGKNGEQVQFISLDDWESIYDQSFFNNMAEKFEAMGRAISDDDDMNNFLKKFNRKRK